MTEKALITPKPGMIVPHPDGRHLAAEGEVLEVTPWWRRRLRDGDVTIGPVPKKQASKPSSKE